MSTELLLGGREAFAPARPTVTYHAIPGPNSVGYQAQVALSQYRMNKELRDQYLKQFRDWRADPKNLASYEQVVRFPSFYSVERFLSNEVEELAEVYKNNNASLLANDRIRRTSSGAVNQASGVRGFAKMLREGWPEGRERLANEALNFHRSYQHIVATPTWEREIVGDEVDIPAFLAGVPEHMVGYHMSQAPRKAISITVDVGVRCNACGIRSHDVEPTHPQALLIRGLMAAMMVQQLARAGHAVTLRTITHAEYEAYYTNTWPYPGHYTPPPDLFQRFEKLSGQPLGAKLLPGDPRLWMRTVVVDVIRPGDPISLDNIMLALAHEGWARQFDFAVSEYYGNLPPFADTDDLNETVSKNMAPYDRSSRVVGVSEVPFGWRAKLASAVDTQADIYIPAVHNPNDMLNGFDTNPVALVADREMYQGIFGNNYAMSGVLVGGKLDIPALARQTYEMLKSVGVEFQ